MNRSTGRGAEILRFIIKKLTQFILVLWIVSLLIFIMVRISGTDPVAIILGGKQTSAETIANLRAKFNLDKPLPVQYGLWISGIFRGDFGLDFRYQQPVTDLIASRLPVTLWLVLMSSVIALVIAVPLGVLSAYKKNTWIDSAVQIVSLLSVSCPSFFISILTVALISRIAPQIQFTGGFSTFSQMIGRLLLPAICLALSMIALASRNIRTGMIGQEQSGYVQMAKANGLRNGSNPNNESGNSGAGGGNANSTDDIATLLWAITSDITALDPAFTYDGPTMDIVLQITEGILELTPNAELVPRLAESWEQIDEVTYVYKIRDNVNFSDGTLMTMEDVLYSLERYRDPELASYLSWMYDNVESIEQTGDWEFTVKLYEADATWQYVFARAAGHVVKKDYLR